MQPISCCGGPTRTDDLQVMSLASYQLLHSAICDCKGMDFFPFYQIFLPKKCYLTQKAHNKGPKKAVPIVLTQPFLRRML